LEIVLSNFSRFSYFLLQLVQVHFKLYFSRLKISWWVCRIKLLKF
jgi:hypothetical protein